MIGIPVRRSQLITTFGPGSLIITPEGEAALVGSLDKWYYDINQNRISDFDEYEVFEPRMKSILKVERLLLPPDYRQNKKNGYSDLQNNTNIYIPLLRFPTWHYCSSCSTLHQLPMTSKSSWAFCKECKTEKKMIQVPFIIACEHGHLSDFPWREWVHENENTSCTDLMKLQSTGGATLDSLNVVCKCGKKRSLRRIMIKSYSNDDVDDNVSELSKRLNKDPNKLYKCPGHKPWFGDEKYKEECNSYPLAILKNSGNVYFPNTISAIYLPGQKNAEVEEILDILEKSRITPEFLRDLDSMDQKIKMAKKVSRPELADYEDKYIELAIIFMESEIQSDISDIHRNKRIINKELREKEYITLQKEENISNLKIKKEWSCSKYPSKEIENYFGLLNRVTKLRETIVLTGFNRLLTQESNSSNQIINGKNLLFKDPGNPENNWLPAFKVYGEGIFFTLNENKLLKWEQDPKLSEYFTEISARMNKKVVNIDLDMIKPSSILLHTLAHILIDQLALTCGYNVASIQERLYVNDEQKGILIYTSSGDIEGTFGGLVRMGKKEYFFDVVEKALDKARWCSSDPVCSEIGRTSGQGIKNLNGAACHNCSYLPETSCELGNLFLDRTLLIDPEKGYFKDLINQSPSFV